MTLSGVVGAAIHANFVRALLGALDARGGISVSAKPPGLQSFRRTVLVALDPQDAADDRTKQAAAGATQAAKDAVEQLHRTAPLGWGQLAVHVHVTALDETSETFRETDRCWFRYDLHAYERSKVDAVLA